MRISESAFPQGLKTMFKISGAARLKPGFLKTSLAAQRITAAITAPPRLGWARSFPAICLQKILGGRK